VARITSTGNCLVPKKPNYGFEKRKKEQDRKAKQEAKRQRKIDEAANRPDAPPSPPAGESLSWPKK
jgi:hypothetical protein